MYVYQGVHITPGIENKLTNKQREMTNESNNSDVLFCPIFKCKCGCNKFAYVGEIPEYTEDGFATGKIDDVLYACADCGDTYFLSELNGQKAMTKTDELLKEFADQEYPLYGSRMDEHREEMRKALIVRLRKLIAQVEEERITTDLLCLFNGQSEQLMAFQKYYNEELNWNGDHITDKDIDAFLSLMKGKEY